ncbi:dicarboxylate/amino acid:cation symporter [Salibacterium salarium]|uniref:Dicarboxylate/amino acid:cation symporter n=1 Tax=Salibacterium salarium TaxID=284579 RepID=A0A3R9QQD8_9BACI|nr:dicarboxylate/amino acid:cation symporter [Salibacterium salarium]RSL31064.1 dicarboxylate/amino acid:cation symporter [Salibacterium salarium]
MKHIWQGYINTSLILKITIALILGIITGLLFGENAAVLEPFGNLLIRLLTFLIIPLILFTLIVGVNQTRLTNLSRMGGKVFLYYIITSALALTVAITLASFINPGDGVMLQTDEEVNIPDNPGFTSVLLQIVPKNIVSAFNEMNLLGIIFTAIIFGIAIASIRASEKTKHLGDTVFYVAEGLNEATFKVMSWVLQYVPIGIFAIMAKTVGNQGIDTLTSLGEMVAVFYGAIVIQLILYTIVLKLFKVNIRQFYSQARTPMITAFVTQSSSGTLPLTLNAAKNLQLSRGLYGFSLPLGATINMDGAAIRIGVSAVFAANVVGASFSMGNLIEIVVVGTLATIGTAGVPGAGLVMIATVFSMAGLPIETVVLLSSIDALVGMGATMTNITGDLTGTTVINATEKKKSDI